MGINSGRGWGLQKGLLVPSGKEFGVGLEEVRRMREVDPEGGGGEGGAGEGAEGVRLYVLESVGAEGILRVHSSEYCI
jgi:hypothetical protein